MILKRDLRKEPSRPLGQCLWQVEDGHYTYNIFKEFVKNNLSLLNRSVRILVVGFHNFVCHFVANFHTGYKINTHDALLNFDFELLYHNAVKLQQYFSSLEECLEFGLKTGARTGYFPVRKNSTLKYLTEVDLMEFDGAGFQCKHSRKNIEFPNVFDEFEIWSG